MPMNPNFLCCIGAELKNSTQQTTRMSQVYLYRAFEDDTLSDMLSAGFFNAAMGIIRQDDLLLLYSPNETTAKYAYTRVSSVSSSGVVIERIGIEAASISVDTTGYSNLSGNNLQEILNNLDTVITTINNAFVKKDGSSIMTGPLKFRAGSFEGAIAGGLGDGISVYKLKADGSIDSEIASLTKTNGFVPGTNNSMDIGRNNLKWKDAYIARVITAVLNNGYDIAVPATNGPDTLALKSQVDDAANSGEQLYTTGVWYAKMYSATTVPTGSEYEGRNYADFSQVDNNNKPIIVVYTYTSGTWTQTATITPPANHNGYMTITSKIWDIVEQSGQQGGEVLWSHTQETFTPYPKIISFKNAALTGISTAPTPTSSSPDNQIANKEYVDGAVAGANYHPDLFDHKWSDYELSDMNWLRADTFSWQSKSAYTVAYNHLADDISGKSLSSETVAGVTVQFYLADDGHKICPASEESNVASIYSATGVAWYYIIDTTNQRFKLPRTKFGTTGLRDTVGKYVAPGVPNVTGILHLVGDVDIDSVSGAFTMSGSRNHDRGTGTGITGNASANFSAQNSNSLYGASSTVQPPATQMYLYFYVGSFSQTALENTAGLNAELFNGKADTDLNNLSATGKEKSANLAMPSDRYVDLTVGASGASYTAPGNGWVTAKFTATGSNGWGLVTTAGDVVGQHCFWPATGGSTRAHIPVRKGQTFSIIYGATTLDSVRFTFSEGEA